MILARFVDDILFKWRGLQTQADQAVKLCSKCQLNGVAVECSDLVPQGFAAIQQLLREILCETQVIQIK